MPEIRVLDHDLDLALFEPWPELLVEQCRWRDRGLDFSALHGDARFIVALVAADDLPLGPDQCVLRPRQIVVGSAGADAAGNHLVLLDRLDRLSRCGVPDHMNRHVGGRATDVVELGRVIADAAHAACLGRGQVLLHDGDHRSVARRGLLHIVHGIEARSARHVGDDDGGLAGDEAAEVLRGKLAVERIAAGGAARNDDAHLLAGESAGRFGGGGNDEPGRDRSDR